MDKPTDIVDGWMRWLDENGPKTGDHWIVPISGGPNSTLTAWLMSKWAGERMTGIHYGIGFLAEDFLTKHLVKNNSNLFYHAIRAEDGVAALTGRAHAKKLVVVGTADRTDLLCGTPRPFHAIGEIWPLAGTWKSDLKIVANHVGICSWARRRPADDDYAERFPVEAESVALELTGGREADVSAEIRDHVKWCRQRPPAIVPPGSCQARPGGQKYSRPASKVRVAIEDLAVAGSSV